MRYCIPVLSFLLICFNSVFADVSEVASAPDTVESLFSLKPEQYHILVNMYAYLIEKDISSSENDKEEKTAWYSNWRAQIEKETPGFTFPQDVQSYFAGTDKPQWSSVPVRDLAFLQVWTFPPYFSIGETTATDASLPKFTVPDEVRRESLHYLAKAYGVSAEHVDTLFNNYQSHLKEITGSGFWWKVAIAGVAFVTVVVTLAAVFFFPPAVPVAGGAGTTSISAMAGTGAIMTVKYCLAPMAISAATASSTATTVFTVMAVTGVTLATASGIGIGLALTKSDPNAVAHQVAISHAIFEEVLEQENDIRLAQEMISKQNEVIIQLGKEKELIEQKIKQIDKMQQEDLKKYKQEIENMEQSLEYYRKSHELKVKDLELKIEATG